MIFPLLAALGLMLSYSRVEAANEDWQFFATNERGERFFYDRGSLTYPAKDVVSVWIKTAHSDASMSKSLVEINCPSKVMRDMRTITEKPNKTLSFSNKPADWRPMERDPWTLKLFKVLCR